MRINSIYLKNFRTHKEIKREFAPGMNLLLGQNGSGKSSILEAIGITLFDSKYRDGSSKGQEQVIRFGMSEALVIIEFTDNEGVTYVVENQLKKGSGYKRLYKKDDREGMIEGKDEINRVLKSLIGIEGDLGGIYENIIVAKQNEFINLYKLKDAERKRVFDGIFETDIYDKIYKGFSKEAGDRYRSDLEKTKASLEILKGKVENPEDILKELMETEKSKILIDENLKREEDIKRSLEKNIGKNIELEKKIERAERDIQGEDKILETQIEAGKEVEGEIELAEKSLKVVNENHEGYQKYCELEEESVGKKDRIIISEEKVRRFREGELEVKNLEKKILEISSEIEKEKIHMHTNRENFQRLKKLYSQDAESLSLGREREELLNLEERKIAPLIGEGESLEREIKKIDAAMELEEIKLSQEEKGYEESLERLEMFKREKLEEKISNLMKKQEDKTALQGEFNKILALLENSREAEKKLITSVCPYLNEKCKNLETSSDTKEFFKERERGFLKSLESIKKSLEAVTEELESLEKVKTKLIEERILEKKILEMEISLESMRKNLEILNLQRENSNFKRENFQRENGTLESLNERKISLVEERKYLNLKIIEESMEKTNIEILDLEKDYKILELREKSFEEKLKDSREGIKVLEKNLLDLKPYIEMLEKEKKELQEVERKMAELKTPYELYNRNLDMALKLESYREKRESSKKNIELIRFGIESLKNNLLLYREELDKKIPLVSLQDEKLAVEEKIGILNRESGSLLNTIGTLKERAKRSQEDFLEIMKLQERERILQKKYDLTGKFRDNVKGMGEKVAESIITRIAFFATENFRKITGRAESIVWSGKDSGDKNSPYSVVLVGADREGGPRKVNFDQLSGGEQVAVAISIRGAMNNIFTKTGFSIFDEPTNNLDLERRKILADNIGEILKDMEQSIIVTHDDTFKEMAQQVIELE